MFMGVSMLHVNMDKSHASFPQRRQGAKGSTESAETQSEGSHQQPEAKAASRCTQARKGSNQQSIVGTAATGGIHTSQAPTPLPAGNNTDASDILSIGVCRRPA